MGIMGWAGGQKSFVVRAKIKFSGRWAKGAEQVDRRGRQVGNWGWVARWAIGGGQVGNEPPTPTPTFFEQHVFGRSIFVLHHSSHYQLHYEIREVGQNLKCLPCSTILI